MTGRMGRGTLHFLLHHQRGRSERSPSGQRYHSHQSTRLMLGYRKVYNPQNSSGLDAIWVSCYRPHHPPASLPIVRLHLQTKGINAYMTYMHAPLLFHKYTHVLFPLHDVILTSPCVSSVCHILWGKLCDTFPPCSDGELQVITGSV